MWIPPRARGIDPKVMERVIALGKMTAAAEWERRKRAEEVWAGIEKGVRVIVSVDRTREIEGLWMMDESGIPKQLEGIVHEVRVDLPGYVRVLIGKSLWRMRREDVEVKREEAPAAAKGSPSVWWVESEEVIS